MNELLRLVLVSAVSILVAGGLALATLRGIRALYPGAWARPRFRHAAFAIFAAWALLSLASPISRLVGVPREVRIVFLAIGGIGSVVFLLMAPFLWAGVWARRRIERASATAPQPSEPVLTATAERVPETESAATSEVVDARAPSPLDVEAPRWTRRELALTGARLAPLGGAMLGGAGAAGGIGVAQVVELELAYPELPAELEGLRILQLSDVHLGGFIDLDEIESLVEQGAKARADLVLLTGDIADDMARFPRALELFEQLKPRYGLFASIGNHEYFRGFREAQRAYDKSNVPLLLERGHTIRVGGAQLHVSGADDPRFLARQDGDFFKRTVATSLDGAPSDAFHVLMSHRPEGFAAAKEAGVHLTLAGHTHGAQLGLGGRSLLEPLLPDKYMWGPYQEGASRLYTSSGAGHWFPFRLGCPRELPTIKLVRGPLSQVAKKTRIA
ncbi:metallophosphoesterase [Myxococcota bacterium]|nr:metallophosphoesterase [Myxococcota bacterium]